MNKQFLAQQRAMLIKSGLNPGEVTRIMSAIQSGGVHLLGLNPSQVHVDTALTNLAVEYDGDEDFVADEIFPVINVANRSGIYWEWNRRDRYRKHASAMVSTRGLPAFVDYGNTQKTFKVSDYSLMDGIPVDTILNADPVFNLQMQSTETITSGLMLDREVRVAGATFNASNYGANTVALTSTARWDDAASDPVKEISTKLEVPLGRPNTLVLGLKTFIALQTHAKFTQWVTGRSSSVLGPSEFRPNEETIAKAFGLDRVIVARGRYDSANSGQTASIGRIWNDDRAALIRVERSPNLRKTRAFGYTFRFQGAGARGIDMWQWEEHAPGARGILYVKGTMSDADVIVGGADSGYLWTTTIT